MHLRPAPLISAILASLSTAHVILESPKPYKFVAYGPSNPIEPTGGDFPCKVPPGSQYVVDGSPTVMAIGEDQTLSFSGQAVHGGGSCQLSLTEETPTKDSNWKVIHSIEGGCPARNQKGNLDGPNKDTYTFHIPEGVAPGSYTFAWTWQARIGGQPEYYMNCAPITVTPAKKKRTNMADRRMSVAKRVDFPSLFMANMGEVSGGCTTEEALAQQVPIAYPNPGPSVERPDGDNLFQQPCDGNPRAKSGAGAGSDNAGSKGTTTQASSPSTSTPEVGVPATSTVLVEPVTSTTSETSASATFSAPAASSDPAAAPISGGDSQACTEGHLTCLDDASHFATCTGGQLTGPQPIAPGFKCRPGSGVGLDVVPT